MSYCPADATSGFIQLTGPITQTKLNQISQKRHPFRTSFTPRTTPATLAQFHISDNANNTCIVNHVTYTVIDIQICKPVHTGYLLPGTTESPSAEMIVSCTAANEVSGMLLCVPIYNTGSARNNQYLSQVIHQPNTINIATLDTVFINQPSFRYRTCFETIHPQNGPSTQVSMFMFFQREFIYQIRIILHLHVELCHDLEFRLHFVMQNRLFKHIHLQMEIKHPPQIQAMGLSIRFLSTLRMMNLHARLNISRKVPFQ